MVRASQISAKPKWSVRNAQTNQVTSKLMQKLRCPKSVGGKHKVSSVNDCSGQVKHLSVAIRTSQRQILRFVFSVGVPIRTSMYSLVSCTVGPKICVLTSLSINEK